jgi:hypothetical protein
MEKIVGKNGYNNFQIEGWNSILEAHCSRLKVAMAMAIEYREAFGTNIVVYQTIENGKEIWKKVFEV